MEYEGWKKLDKVSIIYSTDSTVEIKGKKYPKAYIAETKNKKTIESGIKWAESYEWSKDYKTKTHREPAIVETDNKDFSFQIISAAGNSWSQGGKLSFWMCLMEKDGVEPFAVGINADLLCDLILETTMYNGVTKEKVFFARKKTQLGVLHENMPSYQALLKDEETKKNFKVGKTAKWKPGYAYDSLTQSDVMFGQFSGVLKVVEQWGYYNDGQYILNVDFKAPDIVCYSTCYDWRKFDTVSIYKDIFELIKDSKDSYYYHTKCPSRKEGNKKFDVGDNYYNTIVKYVTNELKSSNSQYKVIDRIVCACALYKYDPNATIDLLKHTKTSYENEVKDLDKNIYPKWVEKTYITPESLAKVLREEKIRRLFYNGYTKPILFKYEGQEVEYKDWSTLLDRMIEIFTEKING